MEDLTGLFLWQRRSGKKNMNKFKKGDKVQIQLGKDRGKISSIERISLAKGLVLIKGLNLVKKHVKKQGEIEGGIIEIPKPLNISNIALICPNCNKPTRVSFKIGEGKKGKVRICRKCKKEILSK